MRVLIEDMEIPDGCDKCPFAQPTVAGVFGYVCVVNGGDVEEEDSWVVGERAPWCPLIGLHGHGDLVDRRELLAEYDRQHKGPAGGARRIMEQATAIIKAED